jgi:hypothetical protein
VLTTESTFLRSISGLLKSYFPDQGATCFGGIFWSKPRYTVHAVHFLDLLDGKLQEEKCLLQSRSITNAPVFRAISGFLRIKELLTSESTVTAYTYICFMKDYLLTNPFPELTFW